MEDEKEDVAFSFRLVGFRTLMVTTFSGTIELKDFIS